MLKQQKTIKSFTVVGRKIISQYLFFLVAFLIEKEYNMDMNLLKSKKLNQLQLSEERNDFSTSLLLKNTLRISIPAALETFLVGLME